MTENHKNEQDDWFTKFARKVQNEPPATAEEIALIKAEREQSKPTKYRMVCMAKDGTIEISFSQFGPNDIRACGDHQIKPGEDNYEEVLRDYGYLKPGESHRIIEELIDGKWVKQESNNTDSNVA